MKGMRATDVCGVCLGVHVALDPRTETCAVDNHQSGYNSNYYNNHISAAPLMPISQYYDNDHDLTQHCKPKLYLAAYRTSRRPYSKSTTESATSSRTRSTGSCTTCTSPQQIEVRVRDISDSRRTASGVTRASGALGKY